MTTLYSFLNKLHISVYLMTAPHVAIKEESDGTLSEVPHKTATPDSGIERSLNVKSSSLTDCETPSVHQYSKEDTVKKSMCKKRNTSTIQNTEIKMKIDESSKINKPVSKFEISSITGKPFSCVRNKPYKCNSCHKSFSTLSSLKRHIGIHTGSKPYTCDTCQKGFLQLPTLKSHIRTHTGSKPYTCNTCNKCFRSQSNLKQHISIHTESKMHSCETCGKCFRQLCSLKRHVKCHTGNSPYTCDTCHKCFSTPSDLRKHTRIHTGSKPFTCDTCHKCFSVLSNLRRHMRRHTEQTIHS